MRARSPKSPFPGRLLMGGATMLVLLGACGGGSEGPTTPAPTPTPVTPPAVTPPVVPPPVTPAAPTTASVVAGAAANTFTPADVVVSPGGVVTWTFGARLHNVVFGGAGAPAAVPNTQNASVARTFPTAGTYPYQCTLHAGMTGTVVVR